LAGPKHSTSVPLSAGSPVPLNVEEKEVAVVPNPVPDLALKALPRPQSEEGVDLWTRTHSVPTLQVVIPLMFPKTVHPKVNVSAGQVGEAGENCPAASPEEICTRTSTYTCVYSHCKICIMSPRTWRSQSCNTYVQAFNEISTNSTMILQL